MFKAFASEHNASSLIPQHPLPSRPLTSSTPKDIGEVMPRGAGGGFYYSMILMFKLTDFEALQPNPLQGLSLQLLLFHSPQRLALLRRPLVLTWIVQTIFHNPCCGPLLDSLLYENQREKLRIFRFLVCNRHYRHPQTFLTLYYWVVLKQCHLNRRFSILKASRIVLLIYQRKRRNTDKVPGVLQCSNVFLPCRVHVRRNCKMLSPLHAQIPLRCDLSPHHSSVMPNHLIYALRRSIHCSDYCQIMSPLLTGRGSSVYPSTSLILIGTAY